VALTGPEALYHDPAFTRFYDHENGWAADSAACLRLARGCASVLDLGCGTGMVAAAIAESVPRVVGVDPAEAMLEVARSRPGGDRVHWVQGDARKLDLGESFDLVILTGHAFQVFLTVEDRAAVLGGIARHLRPGGRFIFDSRNPVCEEWRDWVPERSESRFTHPQAGDVRVWNDVSHDAATGIVTYWTFYQPEGQPAQRAECRIAFAPQAEIAAQIAAAGLEVDEWWGDWAGTPWHATAPEIIPLGRRA